MHLLNQLFGCSITHAFKCSFSSSPIEHAMHLFVLKVTTELVRLYLQDWWTLGFSGGTSGKETICQCRRCKRLGFDPWVEKIPGGGNGNPLQYSCLGNPMDRGAWWATVCGVTKSGTWLSYWAWAGAWPFKGAGWRRDLQRAPEWFSVKRSPSCHKTLVKSWLCFLFNTWPCALIWLPRASAFLSV